MRSKLAALVAVLSLGLPAASLAQHAQGGKKGGEQAAAPAKAAAGAIEISVTSDGWVPDKIHVKQGQKVKLVVTRKTEKTCATEIVIKEAGINQKLPLNQPVVVEFTPKKAGTLRYACGMDMIVGQLVVD